MFKLFPPKLPHISEYSRGFFFKGAFYDLFTLWENPPLEAITVIYEPTQVNGQLHVRCSVGQMGGESTVRLQGGQESSARLVWCVCLAWPQQMILKVCLMGGRPPPAGDISSNFWEQQTGVPVEFSFFFVVVNVHLLSEAKGGCRRKVVK